LSVRICDTAEDVSRLPSEAKAVHAVLSSPQGKVLAWGDSERDVKLWNPSTGKMLKILRGHSHAVLSLAFRSTPALDRPNWIVPFLAVVISMMTLQMSSLGFSPLLPAIQKEFRVS
jgi:hypothetical protein